VLFFAKNVRHFFPQAYITCLLAKGTDKVHILDRKDFDGGIVADIEDALRFIERNTRTAYRIERLKRENIPEYPMKALREAITNAVMHRDWFIEGANVFVEICTDRIEVVSPGSLPKGMTLADLGSKSVRRNALIADLLHRIDFIEKAGTGIKRIRDEARGGGYPEPVWEANGFVTTIFRPNPEVRTAAEAQAGGIAGKVTAHVPHMYRTSPEQVAVLEAAREPKPREELQQVAGIRHRQHFLLEYLRPLLEAGLLEPTIPDKPRSSRQRYRLTRAGFEYLKKVEETK
jgi:ATP-dependent DNA helicase RecG